MAQTLEALRNKIATSIFGRRLGLTAQTTSANFDNLLVGAKDLVRVVTDLTSASTATLLPNHGIVNITGTSLLTSSQVFLLANPIPGVTVTINNLRANTTGGTSGSTALAINRPSTAYYIYSSETSSGVGILMNEAASITLMGLTTALYQVTAGRGVGAVVQAAT